MTIQGKLVDIGARRIFPAELVIRDKKIFSIRELTDHPDIPDIFICPGFIDAHVHIESSMLVPSEFARLAVIHGTIATVSDPHEIANVLGLEGVRFMIENGLQTPFYFYFGAPSCVPATEFETAGATLDAAAVETLLADPGIKCLSEMMNFPGVLHDDAEVHRKISSARKHDKPVDGHAPGLRGDDAKKYIGAGISTDHECFTAGEAAEKLSLGMKILVREGSAARNFEALSELIPDNWQKMMFCSDDKHPDSLVHGHLNQLCARAVAKNIDLFKVLQMACLNPVDHYKLETGRLRPGDSADFILLRDLKNFEVVQTWLRGRLVAENGITRMDSIREVPHPNQFVCTPLIPEDFAFRAVPGPESAYRLPVIEAFDGQLITAKYNGAVIPVNGYWVSDPTADILKIVVVNRYKKSAIAKGFIKNFGLKLGALASSVAHDSHNIVAVGVTDQELSMAVNAIISEKGGISVSDGKQVKTLPLPVAGLMSTEDGFRVAEKYIILDGDAKKLGSTLQSPFMTLSFMALLVTPHVKLSDLGLFDGDLFQII